MFLRVPAVIGASLFLSLFAFSLPAWAAKQANEICFDAHLTQSEKDLCKQQIAGAETLDEQKKVQAKFKARVDERSGGHKK